MDRKQLALIATVCGIVAFIAVFLPWYSVSASIDMGSMPAEVRDAMGASGGTRTESVNGTEDPFNGTIVMILAILAALGAAAVAAARKDILPLTGRQMLAGAAALFGIAVIVTLTDVFRDIPGGSQNMGGMKVEAGKAFGMYLTLLATLAGAVTSVLALQKPDPEQGA